MNKLEEQIDKKSNDWVTDWMHENAFNAGAQFVIDLELDIKFAEWIHNLDDLILFESFRKDGKIDFKGLRKFWIENIYGVTMKTAREWFQCLRPDLRDRAIKATKSKTELKRKYDKFSRAVLYSFGWARDPDLWEKIYEEALDIEEGRKPDIK